MAYGYYADIVSALRAEDHRGAGGLCRDAANEIERLQREVKHHKDLVDAYQRMARS